MLRVQSEPLELRGVAHKAAKSGNVYYVLNTETEDGSPCALYCPSSEALPQGLKKGDMVVVTFEVAHYQNSERLVVRKVEKVQ